MDRTVQINIIVDGVYTDPDNNEVFFQDQTDTYGVRRLDTGATILASGTALTRISAGVYQYELTGLPASTNIEYVGHYVLEGSPIYRENVFNTGHDPTAEPSNELLDYTAFIRKWGLVNVSTAANKDQQSKKPDYPTIQEAFDWARDEIYTALRGGPYVIPLDFTPYSGVVPTDVREWALILAYAWIYETRGWDEKDRKGNKLMISMGKVYYQMGLVRGGVRQINAKVGVESDLYPVYSPGWFSREPDEQPYMGTVFTP